MENLSNFEKGVLGISGLKFDGDAEEISEKRTSFWKTRKTALLLLGTLVGAKSHIMQRIREGKADLKALTPQVRGVDLLFASRFKSRFYWASPKADGVRTVLLVLGKNRCLAIGSGTELLDTNPFSCEEYPFAVDTEQLDSGLYLAFDILGMGGKSWLHLTYGDRIRELHNMGASGNVQIKKIVRASLISKLMHENPGYPIDGIILTDDNTGIARKWKPLSQMTIDFLVKDGKLCVRDEVNGKSEAVVFVPKYQSEDNVQNFGFSVPEPKVAECCWKGGEWKLVRFRDDRAHEVATGTYFGNHRYVADKIWFEIHYPIPLKWLETGQSPYKRRGRWDDHVEFRDFEKNDSVLLVSGVYVSRNPSLRKVRNLFVIAPDVFEVAAFLERGNNVRAIAVAGTPGAKMVIDLAKKSDARLCLMEETSLQKLDVRQLY